MPRPRSTLIDTFYNVFEQYKHQILDKTGRVHPPGHSVWKIIAKEIDYVYTTKYLYTIIYCNRHGIKEKLMAFSTIEAQPNQEMLYSSSTASEFDHNLETTKTLQESLDIHPEEKTYKYVERNRSMDPFVLIKRIDEALLGVHERTDYVGNQNSSADKEVNDDDRQQESYSTEKNSESIFDDSYHETKNISGCTKGLPDSLTNVAIYPSGVSEIEEEHAKIEERNSENDSISSKPHSPFNAVYAEPWNNLQFMQIDFSQESKEPSANYVLEPPDFKIISTDTVTVVPVEFSEGNINTVTNQDVDAIVSQARILNRTDNNETISTKSKVRVSKKRKILNSQPAIKVQKRGLIEKSKNLHKKKTKPKGITKRRNTFVPTAVNDESETPYLEPQVSLNAGFSNHSSEAGTLISCRGPITRSKSQIFGLKQFPLPKDCRGYLSSDEESNSSLESFSSSSSFEREAIRQLLNNEYKVTSDNVTETNQEVVQHPTGELSKPELVSNGVKKESPKTVSDINRCKDNTAARTSKRKSSFKKDNSCTSSKRGALMRDCENRSSLAKLNSRNSSINQLTSISNSGNNHNSFHNNSTILIEIGEATTLQSVCTETRNLEANTSISQPTSICNISNNHSSFHNNSTILIEIGEATTSKGVITETRNLEANTLPETTVVLEDGVPDWQVVSRIQRKLILSTAKPSHENSIVIPHFKPTVNIATPVVSKPISKRIQEQRYATTSRVPEFIFEFALDLKVDVYEEKTASECIQPEAEQMLQTILVNAKPVTGQSCKALQKMENPIKYMEITNSRKGVTQVTELFSSDDEPEIVEIIDNAIVNPAIEHRKQLQTPSYLARNTVTSAAAQTQLPHPSQLRTPVVLQRLQNYNAVQPGSTLQIPNLNHESHITVIDVDEETKNITNSVPNVNPNVCGNNQQIRDSSRRIMKVNHNDAGYMLSKYISEHLLSIKSTNDHRIIEASMKKLTNLCSVYFDVCKIEQFEFQRLWKCVYHYLNGVKNFGISAKDLIILLGDVGRRIKGSRCNYFIAELYRGYQETCATIVENLNQHQVSMLCRSGPAEEYVVEVQPFKMLPEHKYRLKKQIYDYLRLCVFVDGATRRQREYPNSQMFSDNQYVAPLPPPPPPPPLPCNYTVQLPIEPRSVFRLPELSNSIPQPEEASFPIPNNEYGISRPLVRLQELPSTANLTPCVASPTEVSTAIFTPAINPINDPLGVQDELLSLMPLQSIVSSESENVGNEVDVALWFDNTPPQTEYETASSYDVKHRLINQLKTDTEDQGAADHVSNDKSVNNQQNINHLPTRRASC